MELGLDYSTTLLQTYNFTSDLALEAKLTSWKLNINSTSFLAIPLYRIYGSLRFFSSHFALSDLS